MIHGSCLCGTITFRVAKAVGPFEICHCNRCRKKSGSNGLAMLGVLAEDYELLSGARLIHVYAAPILHWEPAYTSSFCSTCGSPAPPENPKGFFEIPAGLLDDSPGISVDKHIYTDFTPEWDRISDDLPQYTLKEIYKLRHGQEFPAHIPVRTHGSSADD